MGVTWDRPLPPSNVAAVTAGHPAGHNKIVDALQELRDNVDQVESTVPTATTLDGSGATGQQAVTAADAAGARAVLGAGTSDLQIGTTSTTAADGEHLHPGMMDGNQIGLLSLEPDADFNRVLQQLNVIIRVCRIQGVLSPERN